MLLKVSQSLINNKTDIINNSKGSKKVDVSFDKRKVKIKVNGQLVYLKTGLNYELKRRFYIARHKSDFKDLILRYYKDSIFLRHKVDEYINNFKDDTHIIKYIMDKLYLSKKFFLKREQEIEQQINNFIMEVGQVISNKKYNTFHLDAFITDNILSDVYGTTTMEGGDISVGEIKNKTSNDKLLAKEAENIYEAFKTITNILNSDMFDGTLSVDLIKYFHSINTAGLDNLLKKGLAYKPGEFRKGLISMGIFQNVSGKDEYIPPEDGVLYLEMLIDNFNKQIKQQGKIGLLDIAIFHLVFYAIHPFWNGNKRTTRVIESLLIQYQFDKLHFLKGMGYWFRKNINTYFSMVKKVLTGQVEAREWLGFYLDHFENMVRYSKLCFEINKDFDISKFIPKNRLYLYSEKDKKLIEYMLVLKKAGRQKITARDLLSHILEQGLIKKEQFQQYKKKFNEKLAKYENDNLIKKTGEKEGKYYLYEILIDL